MQFVVSVLDTKKTQLNVMLKPKNKMFLLNFEHLNISKRFIQNNRVNNFHP